ncbi:Hypothetical predicted protein, partial [Olea europaea subsp. europaea]
SKRRSAANPPPKNRINRQQKSSQWTNWKNSPTTLAATNSIEVDDVGIDGGSNGWTRKTHQQIKLNTGIFQF